MVYMKRWPNIEKKYIKTFIKKNPSCPFKGFILKRWAPKNLLSPLIKKINGKEAMAFSQIYFFQSHRKTLVTEYCIIVIRKTWNTSSLIYVYFWCWIQNFTFFLSNICIWCNKIRKIRWKHLIVVMRKGNVLFETNCVFL